MTPKLKKSLRRMASHAVLEARSKSFAAFDEALGMLRRRPASTELIDVYADMIAHPLPPARDPQPVSPPIEESNAPAEASCSRTPCSLLSPPQPSPRSPRRRPRGPRPDSSTLPREAARFPAVRRGARTQYWLSTTDVLAGVPGSEHVPADQWDGLVRLARDVTVVDARQTGCAWVQLVTAWGDDGEAVEDEDGSKVAGTGQEHFNEKHQRAVEYETVNGDQHRSRT